MPSPQQTASDGLRRTRLFDIHQAIHRQLQDWISVNGREGLAKFYAEASDFRVRNNLRSHHSIPFDPDEPVVYTMLFNQTAQVDSSYLQDLLDYTRNDPAASAYFKTLTLHSFFARLHEIANFRFRQQRNAAAQPNQGTTVLHLPNHEVLNHVLSLSQKVGKAKKFGKLDAADINSMSEQLQALAGAMQKATYQPEQA